MSKAALMVVLVAGSLAFAQHSPERPPAQEQAAAEGSHEAEPDLTLWKFANFALLAGGLGFLIAKHAPPFFASRSRQIRQGIEDAARMRAGAEARAAEMEKRLASLGAEIDALRRSAREEAAAEGERIRTETERDLAKIRAQVGQDIASSLKAARTELRRHSAQLAIELARGKARDRMTATEQDDLVRAFARGIRPGQ